MFFWFSVKWFKLLTDNDDIRIRSMCYIWNAESDRFSLYTFGYILLVVEYILLKVESFFLVSNAFSVCYSLYVVI